MMPVDPLTPSEGIFFANTLIALKWPVEIICKYRNWRGEVAVRRLRLVRFWYGSTEWHPTPGLMLTALDLDRGVQRDFRVADFDTATLLPIDNRASI